MNVKRVSIIIRTLKVFKNFYTHILTGVIAQNRQLLNSQL